MKTLLLSGTISKYEILSPIKTNVLPGTMVAEAAHPYSDYYGSLPHDARPNSIFLFTRKFYFLEEILALNRNMQKCSTNELNMANAIIEIGARQYPAIRLKYFPAYEHIAELQHCFLNQGIEFAEPAYLSGRCHTLIHKLFKLKEISEGIFMDLTEADKGYFLTNEHVKPDVFHLIQEDIRNNSTCRLFDAEQGMILSEGKIKHLVRIYSEGIDLEQLECIRDVFAGQVKKYQRSSAVSM